MYPKTNAKVSAVVFISVYITSIVGAGFASGQEILYYFSRYNFAGMVGLLVFGGLLFAITFASTSAFYKMNTKIDCWSYMDFPALIGRPAVVFTSTVVVLLSFGMMCIMVSGLTNILSDFWQCDFLIWIVMAVVCVILNFKLQGIKAIGTATTPLVILIMLFVVFYSGSGAEHVQRVIEIKTDNLWTAIWNAIIYTGYNAVLPIVVCSGMIAEGMRKKDYYIGAFFGPAIILMMVLCLNGRILMLPNHFLSADMPLLEYAKSIDSIIGGLYCVSIAVAMFSSAIVCGYSLVDAISIRFRKGRENRKILIVLICVIVGLVAQKGFVWLVANVYPVLGIGGSLMILMHLPAWIKGWREG